MGKCIENSKKLISPVAHACADGYKKFNRFNDTRLGILKRVNNAVKMFQKKNAENINRQSSKRICL